MFFSGSRTSSPNKSNSTSNSRSICLYSTNPWNNNGRSFTLRLYFHTIIFHFKFNLVKSNVLHVWLFIPCLFNFSHHMLWNNNTFMLFPSVRRRLSLVVAFVPNVRFHCRLSLYLLLSLFRNKTFNWRCCIDFLIFRLYINYGFPIFLIDRFDRFLCLFLVHQKDL